MQIAMRRKNVLFIQVFQVFETKGFVLEKEVGKVNISFK
jgi:hypothetical protein